MSSSLDQHIVETPEQVELQFAISGVGSRFLAMLVDSLVQLGVAIVVGGLLALLVATRALTWVGLSSQWALAVMIVAYFLLHFGYFAAFEIWWRGQTPGKRAVGIRVMKDTGRPLSVAESIGRNLLRIVDELPALYGIGFVVALLNARSKRLGDFVAGSIVVYDGRPVDRLTPWSSSVGLTSPAGKPPLNFMVRGEQLTPAELSLIETFLARRSYLTDEVRYRMAREVLNKLSSKLNEEARAGVGVEGILEGVVYAAREGSRG